jgi:hypothetical protein
MSAFIDYGTQRANVCGVALDTISKNLANVELKLDKLSLVETVDIAARLQGIAKTVEALASILKLRLIETNESEVLGHFMRAAIARSQRTSLDVALVRAEMSSDWVEAHSKTSDVVTVRFSAR